jgi:CheY-like chemotaxis protein
LETLTPSTCTATAFRDWSFIDKTFIETFLYGLNSIVESATLNDMIDTVNQIHESCKLALDTLNDLLTFDKIDENKLVIECDDIDPWMMVCETAKPFMLNAKEANVLFNISCSEANTNWTFSHNIKGDRFKLSQVIRNLISNALKFTPPLGSVRVKLEKIPIRQSSLSACLDSNSAIRISVEDSGAGISTENQKKLFGQYVQFNASQLQKGNGSGLGLWISRSKKSVFVFSSTLIFSHLGIVELHGGKINAFSAGEGQGATFYLDLPLFSTEVSRATASNIPREYLNNTDGGVLDNSVSEKSMKTIPSKPSMLNNLVRGISALSSGAGVKRTAEHSLLNNRVVMLNTEASEVNLIGRSESVHAIMKRQFATRTMPTDKNGRLILPSSEMSFHVPSRFTRDQSVLSEDYENVEEEEEEEEVDTILNNDAFVANRPPNGWFDHLTKLLHGVSGNTGSNSGGGHKAGKRGSITSRILPSASFLSASSSTYSLPLFLKEKHGKKISDDAVLCNATSEEKSNDCDYVLDQHKVLNDESSPDIEKGNLYETVTLPLPLLGLSPFDSSGGEITSRPFTPVSSTRGGGGRSKKVIRIELTELASKSSDQATTTHRSLQLEPTLSPQGRAVLGTPHCIDRNNNLALVNKENFFAKGVEQESFRSDKKDLLSWEKGLSILIVDDAASNRKMLKKLLLSCGHNVFEAKDGIECLELLDCSSDSSSGANSKIGKIDVLLIDDHMPRMDGPVAVKLLKDRGFPGLIYAVSGVVDDREIQIFLEAGALAVFTKPLNVEALKLSINSQYENLKAIN